jgi:hypothetical protein
MTLSSKSYGNAPTEVGRFEPAWTEYMHYLYLPVAMPGQGRRMPERLRCIEEIIGAVIDFEIAWRDTPDWMFDHYIYVTARRGYATPGNPLNRPGWHADGFGSDDVNYIWTDRYPTRFALQQFVDISDDHVRSAEQFEEQVVPSRIVTYPDHTLLRLDPSVIHATPEIPPPGGERSFLKISLSRDRYNLLGNSHNYLFDYDWKMWSREEVRNDPAYAGGDVGPQEAEVQS